MIEIRERIIIQDDWDTALRNANDKIWIGLKKHGSKTIYGELKMKENVIDETIENVEIEKKLHSNHQSIFSARLLKNRQINVSCNVKKQKIDGDDDKDGGRDDDDDGGSSDESRINLTFKAPDQIFQKVHSSWKTINCLDVTNGGLGVSCDSEGNVRIWLCEDGEVRRELKGHCGEVYTSKFFPSGLVVLTGGADTQLKIWSAEDGKCAATLKGHRQGVTDTAIVDRGRNVVSASRDGTVKLWDCSQSQCLHTFDWLDSGPINACYLMGSWSGLAIAPPALCISDKEVLTEGKILLVATERNKLSCLALHNKQHIFTYNTNSACNGCTRVSEYDVLVGCDDSTLHLVDVRRASSAVRILQESRSKVLAMLSHGAGCFISTSDGSCFYADECLKTGQEFTAPDSIFTMSGDGRYLYTGCRDGLIRRYKVGF
ncbi:hypothetical protein HELRODRAFT_185624 [Helobdella robusta]|uniref:Uncharacterized protein n=1 Tax=Helobdella robusta TaxID=6412 RepID=T1FN20_HELRO|nr:hypothetical protein HELRODRAFT_185624 [Helobdella robusta]ESO03673.1 hypothetical protein HELRODRAFT_185624 [Helobdella robusta]